MERNVLSGLSALALGAVVLGMGAAVQAAPVDNASFETPAVASPGVAYAFTDGTYQNGWVSEGPNQAGPNQILHVGTELNAGQYDGDNVLQMHPGGSSYRQVYQQQGSQTLTAGTTYYISVRVGRGVGEDLSSTIIYLFDGNISQYYTSASLDPTSASAPAEGKMVWLTATYTPSADTGYSVLLRAYNGTSAAGTGLRTNDYPTSDPYAYFDDVRVSTTPPGPIPEPTTAALMGLGLGALALRRRRHA